MAWLAKPFFPGLVQTQHVTSYFKCHAICPVSTRSIIVASTATVQAETQSQSSTKAAYSLLKLRLHVSFSCSHTPQNQTSVNLILAFIESQTGMQSRQQNLYCTCMRVGSVVLTWASVSNVLQMRGLSNVWGQTLNDLWLDARMCGIPLCCPDRMTLPQRQSEKKKSFHYFLLPK